MPMVIFTARGEKINEVDETANKWLSDYMEKDEEVKKISTALSETLDAGPFFALTIWYGKNSN